MRSSLPHALWASSPVSGLSRCWVARAGQGSLGPGPVCVLTPWPRFVPGTSEAVQACESPVGMQGHGLPRPHPAFVGSDEFPRHPPCGGGKTAPPRPLHRGRSQATAWPAASVAVSGAAGPPGCGAVQAQSDEGGRPHPCREAAPSWVGMFLGFWGQFQNQHKGWEGGWRRNPGPRGP